MTRSRASYRRHWNAFSCLQRRLISFGAFLTLRQTSNRILEPSITNTASVVKLAATPMKATAADAGSIMQGYAGWEMYSWRDKESCWPREWWYVMALESLACQMRLRFRRQQRPLLSPPAKSSQAYTIYLSQYVHLIRIYAGVDPLTQSGEWWELLPVAQWPMRHSLWVYLSRV